MCLTRTAEAQPVGGRDFRARWIPEQMVWSRIHVFHLFSVTGELGVKVRIKDKCARQEMLGGEPSHALASALCFCVHHGSIRSARLTLVKSLGSSHHYLFLHLPEKQALVLIASLISLQLKSQLSFLLFTWALCSLDKEWLSVTFQVRWNSPWLRAKVKPPVPSDWEENSRM